MNGTSDGTATVTKPADHPAVTTENIGVLLINLGTPDGTDYWSMRRYLKEFLSDPRVIEAPKLLWWPILNGLILTTRPKRSGEAYAKIWMEEADESPLRFHTRAQGEALADRLGSLDRRVHVDWAMRYGTPSIARGLDRLTARGCRRILLAALYPHYSAATTATAYDKAFDHLRTMRWQPSIRTLPPYHDDMAYIGALRDSVRADLDAARAAEGEPEMLLCSFHGLPKENLTKGDPYHCFCQKTGRLLREALDWPADRFMTVFQSRFGPKEWLQPYADVTVADLARRGVKRLAILSPGFAADCVETLEEIDIGLRETFLENGGEHFRYIPCLNDSVGGTDMLESLIRRELGGWL
ncbi:ferrochelatase [Marivibrio halodurans]|uniref:Ferrochelatase n=1 Tax=Marivibrio halodurans TaxID=2039722 RepID=A0A8J7S1I1_9PROT|nr:ferrochelatase [Marivibrio halodurans]MBP5858160.1 ferrochelatase [Marivibrio halodurans]